MSEVSKLIKEARTNKRLSQQALAEELGLGSGNRQFIGNIERGGAMSLSLAMIICNHLEIPILKVKKAYINDRVNRLSIKFDQLRSELKIKD